MPGDGTLQNAALVALEHDQCLTAAELAEKSGMTNRDLVKAVGRLISRGYARRAEIGCYELTDEGLRARHSGERIKSGPRKALTQVCRQRQAATFRTKVWRALRMKQKATIGDLVETAGDGTEKAAVSNAGRYLHALCKAGYVRSLRRQPGTKATSNGFLRYQLVRDTGPDAPVVKQGGAAVFDPNEGRITWAKGGIE